MHPEHESMPHKTSGDVPLDLLADIGGTNARLALCAEKNSLLIDTTVVECKRYPTLQDMLREYLQTRGQRQVNRAALAVATPVTGDQVALTNNVWSFSQRAVQAEFHLDTLLVLNDFTALAQSLPTIEPADRVAIGVGEAQADGPIALLGAGTGLGMSGLLPDGRGDWVAIAGEGGHSTIAPNGSLEVAIVSYLQRVFGHVSTERVLSGQGLVNIYEAVCSVNGLRSKALQPDTVVQLGLSHDDTACSQALDCFCSFLGSAAGNWALTLGARGGVYIGGGIAPRLTDRLQTSSFRAAFESKGRLSGYLRDIPTWVLRDRPEYALRGAARALSQHVNPAAPAKGHVAGPLPALG
ncbi:MAG: glucokinase [Betaproteobacteria bacterium]|nr:glucokinase [Betaproteobacteria bacterium]